MLRPGGRALFVLHHEQSVLIRNARESLAQGALVLEDTKILRKLRRHAAAERESAAAPRATWAELSAAGARLQQAAASSFAPHLLHVVIDGVQKLLGLRREMGAAGFEREVDRFEREVRAGVRRLQDLVGSAQSAEQMETMAATARRVGLRLPAPRASAPRGRKPRRLAACADATLRLPTGDPAGPQASGGGMRVLHSIPPQRRNIGCPEETGFRWNSRRE